MILSLLLGLLLPCLSSGTPARRNLQIHESRQNAPGGYTRAGPADPDTVLTFYLALAQSDYDGLVDALYDVSTPSSPHYGQYLTAEEVRSTHPFIFYRMPRLTPPECRSKHIWGPPTKLPQQLMPGSARTACRLPRSPPREIGFRYRCSLARRTTYLTRTSLYSHTRRRTSRLSGH